MSSTFASLLICAAGEVYPEHCAQYGPFGGCRVSAVCEIASVCRECVGGDAAVQVVLSAAQTVDVGDDEADYYVGDHGFVSPL